MKGKNPYVGPRAFSYNETLYGRDREVRELLDLSVPDRIVLMYSPSGAGKTSLIHAAFIPALEREDFSVLPVMRVSLELSSEESAEAGAANRYLLSALLSLERTRPIAEQASLRSLAKTSFAEYLGHSHKNGKSRVLIFDQFEEVLTVDPTDHDAKEEFFDQVGSALRNRELWALFSMREDYVAGLDPFLRRIPTRLAAKFRLDLLGLDAGRDAIQKPALKAGIAFRDDAADKLLDDLRAVLVQQSDGSMERQLGPHIEPVQLQVVCHRLWDKVPDEANEIARSDIDTIGDVNGALAGYYADKMAEVAKGAKGVSERAIREWFEHRLITEQETRGQVLQGRNSSDGLPNEVIKPLIDSHLVRSEKRRGANWFELAHDRLIEPVRKNNVDWLRENLNDFQRRVVLWNREGRPDNLLVDGQGLAEAEQWIEHSNPQLTPLESLFLEKCREARTQVEEKREREAGFELKNQQARRNYKIAAIMTVISVIALAALVFLVLNYRTLKRRDGQLQAEQKKVLEEKEIAEGQTALAKASEAKAKEALDQLGQLQRDQNALVGQKVKQVLDYLRKEGLKVRRQPNTDNPFLPANQSDNPLLNVVDQAAKMLSTVNPNQIGSGADEKKPKVVAPPPKRRKQSTRP